ncbi:MAG: phosphate ABC transporter substrate-binding/OmpA family protein [Pseudomonadota bacterium]
MTPFRAALLAASILFPVGSGAVAEDVTLTSSDGTIVLSGQILNYDGSVYLIASEYGVLSVDGRAVICTGSACPEPGQYVAKWRVAGARPGIDVLLPVLLETFAQDQGLSFSREDVGDAQFQYTLHAPDSDAVVARIDFQPSTTAQGFEELADGTADFAVSTREPDATESERVALQSRLLALDALVAVVAPGSTRDEIALDQLAALIGAPGDTPLHLPAANTPLSRSLSERLLVPSGTSIGAQATRHVEPEELAAAVDQNPAAVGITLLSNVKFLRPLPLVGTCGTRIDPQPKPIKTEDYPLTVPHYLYLSGRRLPAMARDFLAFLSSRPARDVINAAGFIDQTIDETSLADQGDRLVRAILGTGEDVGASALRRLVGALDGAARLTPTFRFKDGSADLDAPSRANVALVAAAIADGAFTDRELLVAGFSDGLGGGAANIALSAERATAVRQAIENALAAEDRDSVSFLAQGFGEALPIACDDDSWGRSINRRVELWVR